MQEHEHHRYWLGLHLISLRGRVRMDKLLERFSSAEELWREKSRSLRRLDLPANLIQDFIISRRHINLQREMDDARECGAHVVSVEDEAYPPLLREIADPPLVLFVRGELGGVYDRAVAVVGTRRPSDYGREAAREISQELARQQVAIVSGLAYGIDSAAHRGALQAGGRTIAVMARGIDKVYPAGNRELAEEIVESGALITEMPIGERPLPMNFPRRNRIISGMSKGVLVAEAPEKSGALNTANHALEQSREVFAVPHSIFNKSGRGCNARIQEGAKLVMKVSDVLEELNFSGDHAMPSIASESSLSEEDNIPATLPVNSKGEGPPTSEDDVALPVDDTESLILRQLGDEPVHIDIIIRQTNLSTAAVSSSLTLLELKGLAETAGPMQYCRAR